MTLLQELRLLLLKFLMQSMNKFNNKLIFQDKQFFKSMLMQLNETLISKLNIQLFVIFMFKMHLVLAVRQNKQRIRKRRFLIRYDKIIIIKTYTYLIKIQTDHYDREKTCVYIVNEIKDISLMTVWQILQKSDLKKTKSIWKSDLTARMKKKRLEFCHHHEHWILKNWKNIIWSDKISVVLLHYHGGFQVWCIFKKALIKSCIHERWKDYSEFMFWDFFSYDKKKSFHIWKSETAAEKKKIKYTDDVIKDTFFCLNSYYLQKNVWRIVHKQLFKRIRYLYMLIMLNMLFTAYKRFNNFFDVIILQI